MASMIGFSIDASAFQPFFTDDTGTQGGGGNQLELSFGRERTATPGGGEGARSLPIAYARGLSETIDIHAGTQYDWIRARIADGDARGLDTVSIGLKWRAFEYHARGISFALKPEVRLALASERPGTGFGAQAPSGSLALMVTQELPFGAVHFNIGVAAERYRDPAANPNTITTEASLAPVWNLNPRWKLGLDLGAAVARTAGVTVRTDFVGIGLVYSHDADLDVSVGFFHGADQAEPRTTTRTTSAGLTWRFQ